MMVASRRLREAVTQLPAFTPHTNRRDRQLGPRRERWSVLGEEANEIQSMVQHYNSTVMSQGFVFVVCVVSSTSCPHAQAHRATTFFLRRRIVYDTRCVM